ncbi:MAG: hypothetical protein PWR24_687 [Desulfonauticus sp.]|nr:hypothetical protein [Desulfonauticus sp.]
MSGKENKKIILEVMTQCEAEVISKEITIKEDLKQELKETLEKMRKNKFQSVAWLGDKYLGGTWFDLKNFKWSAELEEEVWQD